MAAYQMVMLRRQDLTVMHKTKSQPMLDAYERREQDKAESIDYEDNYDLDQDHTIIGRLRAHNRRKKRELEIQSGNYIHKHNAMQFTRNSNVTR